MEEWLTPWCQLYKRDAIKYEGLTTPRTARADQSPDVIVGWNPGPIDVLDEELVTWNMRIENAQREGYSFEIQEGCQKVMGLPALNWVVSRNTEVLVGEKLLDENGNDASTWKPMPGVSDLYRVKKQQQIVISLLNRLNEFNSYTDLYNLINALELTFTIDESLTLPNATQILWGYRNFDFSKIKKLTVPTNPYRTDDGKEVLILSSNFYDFITSQGLLD